VVFRGSLVSASRAVSRSGEKPTSMREQVMGAVKVFDEFTVKYDDIHRAYWTNTLSEGDLKQWH
jgi:hypothetical protein